MGNMIAEIFGDNPTVWNWVAGLADLLVIATFVNYGVRWLYRRLGLNENGRKLKRS